MGLEAWEIDRPLSDGLPVLDIRQLHRRGVFAVGSAEIETNGIRVSVEVESIENGPKAIMLSYVIWPPAWAPKGTEGRLIREEILLTWTGCNYGGRRPWVVCPGCQSRRAVLRMHGDRFRCSACHHLVYSSTRERSTFRAIRRTRRLQARLRGATSLLDSIPERPAGMHARTYERTAGEIRKGKAILLAHLANKRDLIASWSAGMDRLQPTRTRAG